MKRGIVTAALVAAAFIVAPGAQFADAHHSTTMFDHAKSMVIRGSVVELRWVNPHVTMLVRGVATENRDGAAVSGGKEEDWLMEMTSPGNLVRAGGWSRSVIKKGDDVIVSFSPLRDEAQSGGALKKVTLVSTGKSYTANIRMQEMPDLE